ncbi:MAG: DUF1501 domain-containing protein [Verrucomicrobiales bacterium]|nr:DUF1501 domain-containing protein [Verrucomicrobiales bacterium]
MTPNHLSKPQSRRAVLKSLSSGFGYLAFAGLSTFEAFGKARSSSSVRAPHFPARAKRVIFLCMKGGPSHVDTFDYKPELQKRNGEAWRGSAAKLLASSQEFRQHGESGLRISSLFPRLAADHADDLCLINSMHTDLPNHPQAYAQLHTGSFQFVRPSLGAWSLYGLGSVNSNLPGFVTLNPPSDMGGANNYGSAFLPAAYQGAKIGGGQLPAIFSALSGKTEEPGPPMKNISNDRISQQMQRAQIDLITSLDRKQLARDIYHPEIEGAIESFELAYRMQDEIPDVLDLNREPDSIRKLYGTDRQGDSGRFARQCLLARRFAEAGVRFIEVTAPTSWDHHSLLNDNLQNCGAVTDQPVAALLTDLKNRGLLQDTLVIWTGEFGRTPYAQGLGDGRDHNNKGFSLWMAGGGVRGGYRHGSTDDFGYKAIENPVHIHDLHATILHLLGLDHERLTYNYAGRDFRLTDIYGNVVKDIIA